MNETITMVHIVKLLLSILGILLFFLIVFGLDIDFDITKERDVLLWYNYGGRRVYKKLFKLPF